MRENTYRRNAARVSSTARGSSSAPFPMIAGAVTLAAVFAVSCAGMGKPGAGVAYRNPGLSADERAADLLSRMSTEEKVAQMAQADRQFLETPEDIARYGLGSLLSGGGSAPGVNTAEGWADMYDAYQKQALSTRLGIPIIYGIDAVHGHNNLRGATVFPHQIGLGAAGDEDLAERVARATAVEVAATGIDWNFAPCLAVPRDERWGRTYEGYGEDPALVSRLGAAAIRGYQGTDLSAGDTILATAKHFVADGGTAGGRDRGDSRLTEAELRSIHLPPYSAAIDSGVGSVMASYSSVNGEKMHGNGTLIDGTLRGEMGFTGFVVSDWAGLEELPGDYDDQVAAGINAGIDMVMIPEDYRRFLETALRLVRDGTIPEARIDEAVTRILTAKFRLGLFERPFADRSLLGTVGSIEHRALAREAVSKSLVVLKNDGLLPLTGDKTRNLLIAGPLADNLGAQCGGWTISWQGENGAITEGTTVLEALRSALGSETRIFTSLKEAEGVNLDAAIVVIGERPYAEGRGDSKTLGLPVSQVETVKSVKAAGVPTVTVLFSGRPMIIDGALEASDAFVAAWLPGSEGAGIADVLLGTVSPSGKLPVSWPRSVGQVPINIGDAEYDPLFPYGFGLTW